MATSDGLAVSERDREMPLPDETDGNYLGSSGKHSTLEGSGKAGTGGGKSGTMTKEKVKIGHRRVDETGAVTYKKKPLSELMAAIQLGIGQSVGGLSSKPERDLLMQDFAMVESVFFPSEGSNLTPAHHYSDFRFKTYAPVACRYFRDLFGIQADDFLLSLCDKALKELSNPGASGSIFYLTQDDEFIIKTVQHKESEFLQKLLPGYYMNLNQNPRTLLPKFYGFYCYQCGGKNIRFVIMNNMLPTSVKLHEKYDLKGSTYKRKASKHERSKGTPTLKDLDFIEDHPEGILLEKDKYDALIKTMQRDCRVLESFKIMDYSLLLGIYNLDIAKRQKVKELSSQLAQTSNTIPESSNLNSSLQESQMNAEMSDSQGAHKPGNALSRSKSMKQRVAQYSTAIEAIQARSTESEEEEDDDDEIPAGGIPAKNGKGERLLMYLGIIDILQSYRLKKKIEHTMKSIVIDADTISVHRPSYYCQRFQDFMANKVFRKMQTLEQPTFKATLHFRKVARLALKHSPSKRKPVSTRKPNHQSESESGGETRKQNERGQRTISFSEEGGLPAGTHGGRPDLLPDNSTPPPSFSEAIDTRYNQPISGTFQYSTDTGYPVSPKSSVFRSSSPQSVSESTPTHTERTEGTPSYTPSSPSCYSDIELQFQAELEKDEAIPSSSTGFVPTQASPSTSGVVSPTNVSSTGFVPGSSSNTSAADNVHMNNGQGPTPNVCDDVSIPSKINSDEDELSSVDKSAKDAGKTSNLVVDHNVSIVISREESTERSSVEVQKRQSDQIHSDSLVEEGEGHDRANNRQSSSGEEEEMRDSKSKVMETGCVSAFPFGISEHGFGDANISRMLRNPGNIKLSDYLTHFASSCDRLGNCNSLELRNSMCLKNTSVSPCSQILKPIHLSKVVDIKHKQQKKTATQVLLQDRAPEKGDNFSKTVNISSKYMHYLSSGDDIFNKPDDDCLNENRSSVKMFSQLKEAYNGDSSVQSDKALFSPRTSADVTVPRTPKIHRLVMLKTFSAAANQEENL